MGDQKRAGDCVHIFNKGVDKRQIFLIREDYERFKALLYILNDAESVRPANIIARDGGGNTYSHARGEPLVRIKAFSLLPTHFHLLAEPLVERGVARFMQKVATGYTMYFNARTLRSGTLFMSGYKSHIVNSDEEQYTRAYIHLTPAQFFHDDWINASTDELKVLLGKITTYPYASLLEYHTRERLITNLEGGLHTPKNEVAIWGKRPRGWLPYF